MEEFLALAFVALIFYFFGSGVRKKEFRTLATQLDRLEKAVLALTDMVGGLQRPRPPEEETSVSSAPGDAEAHPSAQPSEAVSRTAHLPGKVVPTEPSVMGAADEAWSFAGATADPTADPAGPSDGGLETDETVMPGAEGDSVFEDDGEPETPVDDGMADEPIIEYPGPGAQRASSRPAAGKPLAESNEYFRAIMGFIRGGNLWVAGGVIMLLIGFAFLAQLSVFSIELRIAVAALTGMAMVGTGLYLRLRRRMYALIMQGGGIGVLYLSAFATAKLTTLLPQAAALVVMTALIIPAVALAVVQAAQVLALFGFVGGFAAPILLSDGSGNHVALFSCYMLLNLGILAICRYHLWRWLNFAGAFCTFVVMAYWGLTSYDVSKFASTEPFLIGFVLVYILITLGAMRRERFSFAEPLDAILACGIPFVAAVLQWRIAWDLPHGLSISAVAFGAFFILLAIGIWRLWGERARRLAEFYLANGVVLANLAIPLELSGNMTSTIWAIEGAILFFFACRMQSARIKCVALLLQLVGMVAFFWDVIHPGTHTLFSSSIIGLAALSSACFQKLDADKRYLLLQFADSDVPIVSFSGKAAFGKTTHELRESIVTGILSGNKRTVSYEFPGRFPLTAIGFDLPQPDMMAVRLMGTDDLTRPFTQYASGFIYRLEKDGATVTGGPFPVTASRRNWNLVAIGDIPFASAPGLRAYWQPRELLFLARGKGPWTLAYGRPQGVEASSMPLLARGDVQPAKEIASFSSTAGDPGVATPPAAAEENKEWLLWAVLVLAVLFLSGVTVWLARSMRKQGPPS